MNSEWSELNKTMQSQIRKKDTFRDGIQTLFLLRRKLNETVQGFRNELSRTDFNAVPFIRAKGLHNTSILYALWHIFRIEDITAHTLVQGDEQIFFRNGYPSRILSPIITTGNELQSDEIAAFSGQLDLNELYAYITEVKESTETILKNLRFEALRQHIPEERKALLQSLHVVSNAPEAAWLTDYWCGKDIGGIIRMPFSRHWIMHIEACLRIRDQLQKQK